MAEIAKISAEEAIPGRSTAVEGFADGNRPEPGTAQIVDGAFFGTHCRCRVVPSASSDLRLVAHLPQTANLAEDAEIVLMADRSGVVALRGYVGRQKS